MVTSKGQHTRRSPTTAGLVSLPNTHSPRKRPKENLNLTTVDPVSDKTNAAGPMEQSRGPAARYVWRGNECIHDQESVEHKYSYIKRDPNDAKSFLGIGARTATCHPSPNPPSPLSLSLHPHTVLPHALSLLAPQEQRRAMDSRVGVRWISRQRRGVSDGQAARPLHRGRHSTRVPAHTSNVVKGSSVWRSMFRRL